jgi:hypothetical protein
MIYYKNKILIIRVYIPKDQVGEVEKEINEIIKVILIYF